MSSHKTRSLPFSLSQYDISENGFLPAEPPLRYLPHKYYQPWERIIEELPMLIETQQIRQRVRELSILSTCYLGGKPEWRRAHSMLAIIAQGYIWAGPEPAQLLPPAITKPLLQTSKYLEVLPVATYATLNLWNWRLIDGATDLTQPQNLVALHTATGTVDESWFFIISNAIEARAGPLIKTMLGALQAVEIDDVRVIMDSLKYFTRVVHEISELLERMDERCKPQVFYHKIRPFLAGSMNMEAAGLPNGIFYDEGEGKGSRRRYRGGSNGQSSLIQFFDAILSIDHSRSGDFHAEMRHYMPRPHARFLDDVEAIANIKTYVESHRNETELLLSYNAAIASLSRFRDKHLALVTRYIIIPSRLSKPMNEPKRRDIASASINLVREKPLTQQLVGTGGTKLIPFLRTSRDETSEAIVTQQKGCSQP